MKNVTFIIKTFERFNCVKRLVKSIYKVYPEAILLIGDDSEKTCKRYFEKKYREKDIKVYELDRDCGLSYGRNYLLERVKTDYFVLLDDDFVFDKKTNIENGLKMLMERKIDILGGYFRNYSEVNKVTDHLKVLYREVFRKSIPYNYIGKLNYEMESKTLYADYITNQFPEYQLTDIVHNFFIARTKIILETNQWDNDLKLHEHTAFFLNAKKRGIKVAFTNKMSVKHKPIRPKKYSSFRDRDFVSVFMEKNDIDNFVIRKNGREERVIRKNAKN